MIGELVIQNLADWFLELRGFKMHMK